MGLLWQSSVDCGIVELGRMYRRVLESLELELVIRLAL